ncbi:MAG: UDP-glucose/GDP-mannose dehydrogenase family protein [Clostridium sp.]|nr:UDP-glucose/GDP-mannose dehydrogenase family protein [Clostridium sp.]
MSTNIAIVGTGYVGLVSGTCFAEMGNNVTCIDVNQSKIESLQAGRIPIYEPGLDELVKRNSEAGRLRFSTSLASCIDDVDIVFSAVGTPPDEDGSADLQYVLDVAKQFGRLIKKYTILVTKSTVPVGTAEKVKAAIRAELQARGEDVPFDVASNPEFLKEGNAIKDFLSPDRVVVGTDSDRARQMMTKLYKPILLQNFRVIFMDIPSAEMTKYAANAMLATRISFMNDIANLCELVGASVDSVRQGIGSDARIGQKFLYAGCGYGGSCFPKDVKALAHTAIEHGMRMEVVEAVERVNERQKSIVFDKISALLGGNLGGKTVAIAGLAFKPETDDMREAPSLVVIDFLLKAGASVRVFDPIAMDECRRRLGDKVTYCRSIYDAAEGADALALLTEWRQFRMPAWSRIKAAMKGNAIVDGRNIWNRQELEDLGFRYTRIGEK